METVSPPGDMAGPRLARAPAAGAVSTAISLMLAACAAAGCRGGSGAADPGELPADRPEFFAVEAPPGAPALGPAEALVTIVTFADMQSPRARSNSRALGEIAKRFPGEVRVVHRDNPLPRNPGAGRAARAVRAAAAQARFWEFLDALLAAGDLSEGGIRAAAAAVGIDPEQLARKMDDPSLAEMIGRDRRAALDLGLADAPHNFVNGRHLGPIRFVDDVVPLVQEELERARALAAAGIPQSDLYRRLIEGGAERLEVPGRAIRKVRDPEAVHRVPIAGDDPVRGPADAPVTAVLLADFECPFSARLAAALARLSARLGDRLRVVFKHHPSPSRPGSGLLAEAAVEAQAQGRFWRFHDLLFDNCCGIDRRRLIALGREAGLDHRRLAAALDDRRHGPRVAADVALAEAFELHQAPGLFINGRLRQGSLSFDQLLVLARRALAETLELAEAAGGDAGAGATIHDRLTAGGADGPVWLEPGADSGGAAVVSDGTYRVYEVELPAGTRFLGADDAPVTVVEFGDYQCGWCARSREILVALERRYRGKVRIAFLHFPLSGHGYARLAAEAAVEAEAQGRFWEYHEQLVAGRDALAMEDLIEHGRAAGLDVVRLRAALEDRRHRERVRSDRRLGRSLGVAGTPAFFVNGRRASSTGTDEELSRLVEHVLSLPG